MDEPLSNSDLINWWAGFRVFVMKNLAALIKQDELADKDNSGIPTTGPSYRDTFEWLNDHRQFDVSAVKEFLNGDIDIPYDIDLLLKHYASLNPDFNKYTPERIFEALSEIYFGPEEDEENIMPLPEKSPEDRENLGLSNDESPANTKNNKGKPLSKDLAAGLDTDLGDTALDLYQNYKDTGDERYLEQAKALSKKMGQRFSAQSLEIQLRRAALVAQASTMGLNHGLVSPRKRAAAASDTDDSSTDLDSDEEPSFGGKQFVGFVKPNIRSTEGEGTQVLARKRKADAMHPAAEYQYGEDSPVDTSKPPTTALTPLYPKTPAPTTPPPAGKKYVFDPVSKQYVLADAQAISNTPALA